MLALAFARQIEEHGILFTAARNSSTMGKKRLFDEVEDDNDEAAHLSVNEEYAARLMVRFHA